MKSWSGLFKLGKAGADKADTSVRWFGKLPTYGDYYSSKTDQQWVVEFNDWLLKGFQLYRVQQGSRDVGRLPNSICLLRLPRSEMTVIAVVQDYGGDMLGRPFPLCFFVGLATSQYGGPLCDQYRAFSRVASALDNVVRKEIPCFLNAPGVFDRVFGDCEIDLSALVDDERDTSWRREGVSMSLGDWWAGASPDLATHEFDAWFAHLAKLGRGIASMDAKDVELAVRFPLAPAMSLDVQIAGWIRWLEGHTDLSKRSFSIVVERGSNGRTGAVSFVVRDLLCDDFLLLTPAAGHLAYVDDLITRPPEADGEVAPARPADFEATSWSQFVETVPGTG